MKCFPFLTRLVLLAGVVFASVYSFADEHDDDLVTIVVTSSRHAETVDETMAPVTVIERNEIERSSLKSVDEILARVPGLLVTNNGGRGALSSIFLRGTAEKNILVLVDGVAIGSVTSEAKPLEHIPLSLVEKIEVVRGPRSSLYGSAAIGGVIQIFTRRGGKKLQPHFLVSAGSHDTHEASAGVSGRNEANWYGLHVSSMKTDGFDFLEGSEPDKDGYRNRSLNLKGGMRFSDVVELSSGLTLSDIENEYDGYTDKSKSQFRSFYVKSDLSFNDEFQSSLTLSESTDKSDNFKGSPSKNFSRFNTGKKQASWQNEWDWGNHRLISGIDFLQDQVASTINYKSTERDNIGYFALIRSELNSLDIEASIRLDDNEQYGEKSTGSLALGRDFKDGWRLIGSYGTGFRAPTFNELYYPGGGDPKLKPEEASSLDIGIGFRKPKHQASLNIYRTEIKNLIAGWPAKNVDKAKITGIEIGFQTAFANFIVNGSITYQEPLNDSGSNRKKLLVRRPKQLAFLEISQNLDPWTLGVSLQHRGDSYNDAPNAKLIDGFVRTDMHIARTIKQDWSVKFKVSNVFDKSYVTAKDFSQNDYRQDGRNYLMTFRYAPK